MATIPWTINATTTGRDLVSYRRQYGYQQSIDPCHKQDTIHTATNPWTFNATTTGRDLVCFVNWTIAIYWSMSQTVSIVIYRSSLKFKGNNLPYVNLQFKLELGPKQCNYKLCAVINNIVKQSQYWCDRVIYIFLLQCRPKDNCSLISWHGHTLQG